MISEATETHDGPRARYRALVAAGELRPDGAQAGAAIALDRLASALAAPKERGLLCWFRGLLGSAATAVPRGIYLHGDVGRGKSMLMDLFFDAVCVEKKRRVHFHEFMQEVHARLKAERQRLKDRDEADPIPAVARAIANEARLLCFDEFQVSDVADAMILGRLFSALLEAKVTVVATSNRKPQDLYKDGLNRSLFLPFIDLLRDRLDMLELDGPTDYRLDRLAGFPVYYTPVDQTTSDALSAAFFRMTDHDIADRAAVPSADIEVMGRAVFVPKSLKGVAVFSFKRLCASALGAADYLAIARRYHTVIVVAIPRMGPDRRNEAKRFVTLIDALYEMRVKLLCSAETAPDALYEAGDGAFEFARTVSRLKEMQSEAYLAKGHGA